MMKTLSLCIKKSFQKKTIPCLDVLCPKFADIDHYGYGYVALQSINMDN